MLTWSKQSGPAGSAPQLWFVRTSPTALPRACTALSDDVPSLNMASKCNAGKTNCLYRKHRSYHRATVKGTVIQTRQSLLKD